MVRTPKARIGRDERYRTLRDAGYSARDASRLRDVSRGEYGRAVRRGRYALAREAGFSPERSRSLRSNRGATRFIRDASRERVPRPRIVTGVEGDERTRRLIVAEGRINRRHGGESGKRLENWRSWSADAENRFPKDFDIVADEVRRRLVASGLDPDTVDDRLWGFIYDWYVNNGYDPLDVGRADFERYVASGPFSFGDDDFVDDTPPRDFEAELREIFA